MPSKNKNGTGQATLHVRLRRATLGLVFLSETDAPIKTFFAGSVDTIDVETLRRVTKTPLGTEIEVADFEEFFQRLTEVRDWHTPKQKADTVRFEALERLMAAELRDLAVYRVGKIRIRIYAVGLDRYGGLAGIATEAVET
ncbi:MAG: nuclease A inhibitor family protein [Acidobacteriota bacterium]